MLYSNHVFTWPGMDIWVCRVQVWVCVCIVHAWVQHARCSLVRPRHCQGMDQININKTNQTSTNLTTRQHGTFDKTTKRQNDGNGPNKINMTNQKSTSEVHKEGHMTTGHSVKTYEILTKEPMPRHHMPLLM